MFNTFIGIGQQLILPSTFVFLIILLGIIFLCAKKRNKKTFGKSLIILGLVLYYIFSITPTANFLLFPLENKYSSLKSDELDQADKAVLLLGGRESDVLRASEILRITHKTNHKTQIIISGTDPLNPKSEEAEAVRNFFTTRGVPAENIIIEGKSRNTWENVRNVKEIIKDDSFFLVTSAYHMPRALKEFQRVNAFPIPAPTDFKTRLGSYYFYDFIPDSLNLRRSDLAIKEHIGILYYQFLFKTNFLK